MDIEADTAHSDIDDGNETNHWVHVNRPAYTKVRQDEVLGLSVPKRSLRQRIAPALSISKSCTIESAKRWFPFVDIFRRYKRSFIVGDIIAGVSVGVMHLPQGLGFALLAGVPPIYGLYSSFFPTIVYFFFGTSRHACVGTMALVSILIGSVVARETKDLDGLPIGRVGLNDTFNYTTDRNGTNMSYDIASREEIQREGAIKMGIAASMSLLVGLFQIAMGVFSLGGLAIRYMPSPFVGGFTTGAAFHIVVSQLKFLLGIKVPQFTGLFQLPRSVIYICENIASVNIYALLVGVLCMLALIVIKCINSKWKSKLKIPIPAELIVVIVVTIISHFANFSDRLSIVIVGRVPKGFEVPALPPLTNVNNYLTDALITAMVSFAISISIVKLFAEKYEYTVDVNQETFAFGMCNFIGSFFHCFAGAIAPPRCFVFESTGGKSQIANLVSSVFLLLIILAIGPLFQSLPNTVLGGVIIVAVIPLLMQFRSLRRSWLVNPWDCVIWFVTWAAVVVLDIALGVVVGIGFSIIVLLVQTHRVRAQSLYPTEHSDIFALNSHKNRQSIGNLEILRFDGMLCFANADSFKNQILDKIKDVVPKHTKDEKMKNISVLEMNSIGNKSDFREDDLVTDKEIGEQLQKRDMHSGTVIIDCCAITYIDTVGLNILTHVSKYLNNRNFNFYLANCNREMLSKMASHHISKQTLNSSVFPTLQDAVAFHNISNVNKITSL